MTTKLEQEFYKTFEIEPATVQEYGASYFWDTIEIDGKRYTPIDDRKLLEMICILNLTNGINCTAYESKNISDLKKEILDECMSISNDKELKTKIQQLFKEGE